MPTPRLPLAFVASVVLLATLAVPGFPQRTPIGTPTPPNPIGTSQIGTSQIGNDPHAETDPAIRSIELRQQHARNDERQKRLVADTDKLLALATQLHDDVGKTDKNILSLDVVKRAEEIEKLAHSVKERMKG